MVFFEHANNFWRDQGTVSVEYEEQVQALICSQSAAMFEDEPQFVDRQKGLATALDEDA